MLEYIQNHTTFTYVCVVLFVGILILFRVIHTLNVAQRLRKQKLSSRQQMNSVTTESPIENSEKNAKTNALSSIDRHASVSRRLLVPMILFGTLAMATIPLLSRVPATMISIVVAVATVILGVAARPLIENAMSGLVISFSRLMNIGDTVRIEDYYGTIEDISITHTTIKLWDWRRYVVPNSRMLQQSFINYSVHDKYEWTHVSFTVSYEVNIAKVRDIALKIPSQSKFFAHYENPQFWIMDMGDQGYEIWLAAWADTPSDAWNLRTDIREGLITAFQRHGIPVQRMRHEVFTNASQRPL